MPEFSIGLVEDEIENDDLHEEENNGSATSSDDTLDNQDEVASELLHNLSLEFRTPLNAIIGFSQMIDSEMWGLSVKITNKIQKISLTRPTI